MLMDLKCQSKLNFDFSQIDEISIQEKNQINFNAIQSFLSKYTDKNGSSDLTMLKRSAIALLFLKANKAKKLAIA